MVDHRQALQALYRAPLANFVAERKRLAAELRAAGDEDAAKQLAQRRRPPASAWAVNQLHWHARGTFDDLLAAAARIRNGDLTETSAYHEALGELRKRAAALLRDAAHAATPATLRRVLGSLAAVAAAGGFDPDPPGALASDREPPGFDAVDKPESTAEHEPHRRSPGQRGKVAGTAMAGRKRLAAARAEERARKQAETKARVAERRRLETALRDANAEVRTRERRLLVLRKELQAAEKALADGREAVRDIERELEGLDDAD